MQLHSNSIKDQQPIPGDNAFAVIDPDMHVSLSANKSPHLAWDQVPAGTRSFVIICLDPDVPSKPDDVNKEDREIPADLPRVDFYHWSVFDLHADLREIPEGAHADGITPKGKAGPAAPGGARHGLNNYTDWFAGDSDMEGQYYGYDGPCPPWNDSIVHRYVFTVYALDVAALDVEGELTGVNIRAALDGHILGQASITGTYTLNPRLVG